MTQGIPPQDLKSDKRKQLALCSQRFSIIHDALCNQGVDATWRRCIQGHEKLAILKEAHEGVASGHYSSEVTARKVWFGGLWYPSTFTCIQNNVMSVSGYDNQLRNQEWHTN